MKKFTACIFALSFVFLVACSSTQRSESTSSEAFETESNTELQETKYTITEPDTWPDRGTYPDGHDLGDFVLGKYRPAFYSLPYPFATLVGTEVFSIWERSRNADEFHNECAAVSFIRDFNISREDFERANNELQSSQTNPLRYKSHNELQPVDLIYTFDNAKINEFFIWENSIYAHEIGLPNPLRGDWDEDGVWYDHLNWTENTAWRKHKFWAYLPFNDETA